MTKANTRARALQSATGGPLAVAAYGSWKSPITSNLIARQSIKLLEVRLDGDDIYWLEDRPQENSRCVVVRAPDSSINSEPYSARTEVHTYGRVHGLLTMAPSISATIPIVACIGKIITLRSRSRSRPHLLRRKEIGAMPMA
jgi:hypothetical protein